MTTTFKDAEGRSWSLRFDGLLLTDLRTQHGINLADLTGSDYLRIEEDPSVLVTALCLLLRDACRSARITREQLAAALVGEALDDALAALWEAAKVFFPPKRWSALQSNYSQLSTQWQAMSQALALLGQPGVPPALVETLSTAILQGLASTVSRSSAASASATGPDATPSSAASD